jgi:hypothetical protein
MVHWTFKQEIHIQKEKHTLHCCALARCSICSVDILDAVLIVEAVVH